MKRNLGKMVLAAVLAGCLLPAQAQARQYQVAPGDTLGSIGARFGVPWQTIAEENGITDVYKLMPGTVLTIGGYSEASGTYTVVYGDTLAGIAAQFGMDWRTLAEMNNITDPTRLRSGTVLLLRPEENTVAINVPEEHPITEEAVLTEDPVVAEEAAAEAQPAAEEPAVSEAMAYREIRVDIPNPEGAYAIPAVVTLPAGEGPFPAVVMLHGTGSDKDEAGGGYALAAPIMAEAGLATVRIDFLGSGESTEDYINYSYTTGVSDAYEAARYIGKMDEVDESRIGIMGWSQGGTVAMVAAGTHDTFKSVVTWAGATGLGGIYTEEGHAEAREQGYTLMEFDWRDSLNLGLAWYEDVAGTDVLGVFANSAAPVLAINGMEDTSVSYDNAEKIVAASSQPSSEVYLLENCDHTFNIFSGDDSMIKTTVNATVAFFLETLAVEETPVEMAAEEFLTLEDYLANAEYSFFETGKVSYTVEAMMVSEETPLYNELEDAHYTVQPNGEDVIIRGLQGEQWVTSLENVMDTYTNEDGTPLSAGDFALDNYIPVATKVTQDNFACFIPLGTKVQVESAWGETLYANRDGVEHGEGDYLVCRRGEDGSPDLSDVWIVNGDVFPDTYDMINFQAANGQ